MPTSNLTSPRAPAPFRLSSDDGSGNAQCRLNVVESSIDLVRGCLTDEQDGDEHVVDELGSASLDEGSSYHTADGDLTDVSELDEKSAGERFLQRDINAIDVDIGPVTGFADIRSEDIVWDPTHPIQSIVNMDPLAIRAEFDTGTRCSCTNVKEHLHNYVPFTKENPCPFVLKPATEGSEATPVGYGELGLGLGLGLGLVQQ